MKDRQRECVEDSKAASTKTKFQGWNTWGVNDALGSENSQTRKGNLTGDATGKSQNRMNLGRTTYCCLFPNMV
jgi:hypothetical protein